MATSTDSTVEIPYSCSLSEFGELVTEDVQKKEPTKGELYGLQYHDGGYEDGTLSEKMLGIFVGFSFYNLGPSVLVFKNVIHDNKKLKHYTILGGGGLSIFEPREENKREYDKVNFYEYFKKEDEEEIERRIRVNGGTKRRKNRKGRRTRSTKSISFRSKRMFSRRLKKKNKR